MLTTDSKRAMPLTSLIRILAMTLSPFGHQVAQAIDQVLQGESGGACSGREFSGHLTELPFAFDGIFFQLLLGDECSRALVGFEKPPEFQFAIGAHHSIGINGQIDGQLANGGQLIARSKGSRSNSAAHLIDDLAVDRHAAVQIEGEPKSSILRILSHDGINVLYD